MRFAGGKWQAMKMVLRLSIAKPCEPLHCVPRPSPTQTTSPTSADLNINADICRPYFSTSPSFYLQMVGTARVMNDCRQVGSIYTNPIVLVAVGDSSTISLNHPPGGNLSRYRPGREGSIHQTGQSSRSQLSKQDNPYQTIGPPLNTIMFPPTQLISLDPAWVGSYSVCKSLRK